MNGSEQMVNNKVYFSKSNAVSKETVDKIRRYLLKFDIELKEFTGGTYSNSAMDECEFLIVLPPPLTKKRPGVSEVASVGRGIFQQTQYFYSTKHKIKNILIITAYGLCENKDVAYVEFSTPDYWNVRNQMDYVNYGDIHLQRDNSHVSDYFLLKKSPIGILHDIYDSSGSMVPCNLSEPKDSKIHMEFEEWDDVYGEWFQNPVKEVKKSVIDDLVINPEDPEDYSLLLTI
jgi:hypothetical protein